MSWSIPGRKFSNGRRRSKNIRRGRRRTVHPPNEEPLAGRHSRYTGGKTMKMLGAFAFSGLVLIAGAADAQTHVESPPDPYVHRGTGFAMPAKVGDFVRGTVTEYNAEASDAGANYDLIVDGQSVATVTVYVYPPASLGNPAGADGCKASFDGAKQAIVDRFPDARLQR